MADAPTDSALFAPGCIFENRELLRVGHVPTLDRVVGRTNEVTAVARALAPGTRGGPPETTIVYGKTGTGKSLVSRCVTNKAQSEAARFESMFRHSYVDCSDYQTETAASREMARQLATALSSGMSIPRTGLAAADYRDITWELLDDHLVDAFVVILDEIDKLENDELLRSLTRARESKKSNTHIGAICISNKVEYRDRLNERLDSSLQDNELVFTPYDASQINAILSNREDAFIDGVLEESVIPKIAALAAKEHGDARKAVDTLYEAGRLAEKRGTEQVTTEHVDEAVRQAEINRFQRLIDGSTPHVKYVLQALALLTERARTDEFRTHRIYEVYTSLSSQDGSSPLSEDRVYRLLKEQAFLGVTESHHTGGGPGEGSYLEHRLLCDPEVITEALTN